MRGKPIRVLNNALALALDGHDLDIATYGTGQALADFLPTEYRDAGRRIAIHRIRERLPSRSSRPGLSVAKLVNNSFLYMLARRLLRRNRYDAIIAHDADGALIAMGLPKGERSPLVYDMHGSLCELMSNIHDAPRPLLRVAARAERRIYARADLILANWPHLLAAIGIENADKVSIVPDRPPVTTPMSVPASHDALEWKRRYDIEKLLVYVGNGASYQRVDLIIEMMSQLSAPPSRVTLCLVGPDLESYKESARKIPGADIRFLGPRSGEKLAELLASADVALSPRITENYPPMKVISYFKAGVPVIATDCSAHRTMVKHEVNGLLAAPTAGAFAAATRRLLLHDDLHAAIRQELLANQPGYSIDSLRQELRAACSTLPELADGWTS